MNVLKQIWTALWKKGIKVLFTLFSTSINNLEQKLCIIENVGGKNSGPLSAESAKIYLHGLSFKQKNDHTCYIIKYSETILVPYDKWNQELEQTNGTERRTVRRWLVHIPVHSFL